MPDERMRGLSLLEAAERVVRRESDSLPELAGGNPMTLLLEPPGNYLGTLAELEGSALPRRS